MSNNPPVPKKKVLEVLTSHGDLGGLRSTGFDLTEASHPWQIFTDAGYRVDLASIAGGVPPEDGHRPEDPIQQAFLSDERVAAQLRDTLRLEDVDITDYDAIFFVGGYGAMWDFPDTPEVAAAGRTMYEKGGVVAAICHGPAALVNLKLSDGSYLVNGKTVAAFTDGEEEANGTAEAVPFLLADKLAKRGAHHVPGLNFTEQVEVDGRLITGQNPASATELGHRVVHVLEQLHATVPDRVADNCGVAREGSPDVRVIPSIIPVIPLNDRRVIPQLGFGVFQVPDDQAHDAVAAALQAGYRHVDTAAIYQNERGVGRAITESGIPRDELYVVTKLWNADQGYDSTFAALSASLERLGLDYVDLYLIHWPLAAKGKFIDTFRAFQAARDQGLVRSIGVSNFQEPHLRELIAAVGETPALNQVELHPHLVQAKLRKAHAELGIATEAWSPLGQGANLTDPHIVQIAQELGKSPAQVIIRWHLQLGNVVIPKSATPARIAQNLDVFDFELTEAQVDAITGLPEEPRVGPDPDVFDWDGWPGE